MNNLVVRVMRLFSKRMKERADAAAVVIRYLAAQPFIAKVNSIHLESKGNVQQDGHPLSKSILKHLQEKGTQNEELKFFGDMFDPQVGVVLPEPYLAQNRIKEAIMKVRKGLPKKFTFFPNRIITPLIFKQMYQFQSHQLLYGAPGISKTSNIIFFCYLANLITEYDFSMEQQNSKTEYPQINRFVYLSHDPSVNFARGLKKKLNEQLPPKVQLKQFNQHAFLIRDLFQAKGLNGKVVLDQFNSVVALARTYNQQDNKTEQSRMETQNQIKLWFKTAKSIFEGPVLYNSSINIELPLLGKSAPGFISFDLDHHQEIPRVQISLHASYTGPNWVASFNQQQDLLNSQMVEIIFFEIAKTNRTLPQATLQQAKQLVRQEVGQKPEYRNLLSVFTFLDLRASFKDFLVLSQQKPQNLKDKVIQRLMEKQNQMVEKKIKTMDNYLAKLEDPYVPQLMIEYYQHMVQMQNKHSDQCWMQLQDQWKQWKTYQKLDKNLFRVNKYMQTVTIRTVLSAQNYFRYVKMLSGEFKKQLIKLAKSKQFMKSKSNQKYMGFCVQNSIINEIKENKEVNFLNFHLSNSRITKFVHFNSSLKQQLDYHLRFLKQKPKDQLHYVALSYNKGLKNSSSNSPSIDFMIYNYNSKKKVFQLNSIDIKLSQDNTYIKSAIAKVEKLWKRIFKIQQGKWEGKKSLTYEQKLEKLQEEQLMMKKIEEKFREHRIEWNHIIVSKCTTVSGNRLVKCKHFGELDFRIDGVEDSFIKQLVAEPK